MDWVELGKRAVACKHFRWMHGMLAKSPVGYEARITRDCTFLREIDKQINHKYLPDLRDPATLGCLLHLVREVHGPVSYTEPQADVGGWFVWLHSGAAGAAGVEGDTEAEALVIALETAP